MALIALPRNAIPSTLFEEHHVLGRRNSLDATVTLCRNHHALLHEGYREAGALLKKQPSVLHVLDVVLRALAVFLRALADSFDQWGATLEPFTDQLDAHYPGWRTLDGA